MVACTASHRTLFDVHCAMLLERPHPTNPHVTSCSKREEQHERKEEKKYPALCVEPRHSTASKTGFTEKVGRVQAIAGEVKTKRTA